MFGYKLKYRIRRLMVIWRHWRRSIDNMTTVEQHKLTPSEEKAIRLWRICLRSEETQMQFDTSGVRQINKEEICITFKPAGNRDYIMTVMYIKGETQNLYELHIPEKYANTVCDYFDIEMQKRMRRTENSKRSIIESSIDKLLEQEEKVLLGKISHK